MDGSAAHRRRSERGRPRLREPTTRGTRFEDCDLRDTDWAGRNLNDATFVRCKLAGAHGKPKKAERVALQDCDITLDALLGQLV